MNTDHPTTLIYFVFAFTRCSVRVYTNNLLTMRLLLAKDPRVEIYTPEQGDTFQEIGTPLLIELLIGAIPHAVEASLPNTEEILAKLCKIFQIETA